MLSVAPDAAVEAAGIDPSRVIGIATDFTACTMVPTLADGTPLNEVGGLADRPHAYVKLWKHHAAQAQADRINELARTRGEAWLPRYLSCRDESARLRTRLWPSSMSPTL